MAQHVSFFPPSPQLLTCRSDHPSLFFSLEHCAQDRCLSDGFPFFLFFSCDGSRTSLLFLPAKTSFPFLSPPFPFHSRAWQLHPGSPLLFSQFLIHKAFVPVPYFFFFCKKKRSPPRSSHPFLPFFFTMQRCRSPPELSFLFFPPPQSKKGRGRSDSFSPHCPTFRSSGCLPFFLFFTLVSGFADVASVVPFLG